MAGETTHDTPASTPQRNGLPRLGRRIAHGVRGLLPRLTAQLWRERTRWALWLAPAFGTGVATYFALPNEPPQWVGLGVGLACLPLLTLLWRRGSGWSLVLLLLLCGVAGFAVAQGRTLMVEAPVLSRPLGPVDLRGQVVELEPQGQRWRVTLARLDIARLDAEQTPERVRVSLYADGGIRPGDSISLRARLLPPQPPVAPGAYDFPRQAFFERLGAVGFAVSVPQRDEAAPRGGFAAAGAWIETLRTTAATRLQTALGAETGSVAAALSTGHRGAVPEAVRAAYRDAGLAHLLAISGLHMGLVAGLVFVVVRSGAALVPWLALRVNTKKVAALAAIATMAAYLALSGANIPAQRAFLMGSVVCLAILFDRSALTLRVLALAAVVVLLWQPEAIVGASFQLSFAAVASLIATYEVLAPRLTAWRAESPGRLGQGLRAGVVYGGAIMVSSVVSTLATAPYTAWHFHAVPLYALAANLAAMPIMSLWVMPWLMLALLLMPFGLDSLTHLPLRWGLEAIEAVATTVAGWPGAVLAVPPSPGWAVAVATLAGLWLCLWQGRWRLLAVPPLLAVAVVPWLIRGPDVLVLGDGSLWAVRSGPGLVHSPGRGQTYARSLWEEHYGLGRGTWGGSGLSDGAEGVRLTCDAHACLYQNQPDGPVVALVFHDAALREDCQRAAVVVSRVSLRRAACPVPVLITRSDLWTHGTHALWIDPDGTVRSDTVAAHRGNRPWSHSSTRW